MCELTLQDALKQLKIPINNLGQSINLNRCEDNYVGKLSYKKSNLFISKQLRLLNKKLRSKINCCSKNKLVVVLESPHINEFSKDLIAPALGKTGIYLNYYLREIFNDLVKNERKTYKVFLLNCVPYQCSLGGSNKNTKNKIFKHMYTNYWEDDLLRRLKEIKPSIVLVATTKIPLKGNSELKFKLLEKINSKLKLDYLYFSTTHPSIWYKNFEVKDYKNNNKIIFSN